MLIKELSHKLETWVPLAWQESYDNCGFQVGFPEDELTGVLTTLDVTMAVLEEAKALKCNMVLAHHPLLFQGLKSITGKSAIEQCVLYAIQNRISIYAIHTNLDNYQWGVNAHMADRLGLVKTGRRLLQPKINDLVKVVVYVPATHKDQVQQAMWQAGAGNIGLYEECGFEILGQGTFKPNANAQPHIGQAGGSRETVEEWRIEVLVEQCKYLKVVQAAQQVHPYEEMAYDCVPLLNQRQDNGAGLIGQLAQPMPLRAFVEHLKLAFNVPIVKCTKADSNKLVQTVAICGGAGSFLMKSALANGADVFVSSDFKYHQFFELDFKMPIIDMGHFETEQFTKGLLQATLAAWQLDVPVIESTINTNPIDYL